MTGTAKSPRFVFSPKYVVDIGDHVFPTRKFALAAALLAGAGEFVEPEPASREDLLLAHDAGWVDKVLSGRMALADETLMEMPFSPEVSLAHRLQAGGTILAAEDALERGVGLHVGGGSHHAFADHAEGFCVLNDIACAIAKLLGDGRIKRVAVVDLDVHQGNGTAAIFRGRPEVFTFSMHQESIYPFPKERGTLDVGLPDGTKDDEYLRALERHLPRVFEHGADLVVYQAGVDVAEGDLLGGLRLTDEGILKRDELICASCRRRTTPLVVTLGGGYSADVDRTARLHAATLRMAARSGIGLISYRWNQGHIVEGGVMAEQQVGAVDHFFSNISVSMIKLTEPVKVGDKLRIKGKAGELVHAVSSMQINRVPAQEGKAGDVISLKVEQKVRPGDLVFKVVDPAPAG
ncbi:MAG: histone deacetylase [Elusimicrobia bacterium]|nr:histone deacetylase [Elusimicrobiota bacterium]